MELKLSIINLWVGLLLQLLIAPLWNWNTYYGDIYSFLNRSFNRTFMELKRIIYVIILIIRILLIAPLWNWNNFQSLDSIKIPTFNRTFMELKPRTAHFCYEYDAFLLIAPLWNWNFTAPAIIFIRLSLLIAPLWNWNCNLAFSFKGLL